MHMIYLWFWCDLGFDLIYIYGILLFTLASVKLGRLAYILEMIEDSSEVGGLLSFAMSEQNTSIEEETALFINQAPVFRGIGYWSVWIQSR